MTDSEIIKCLEQAIDKYNKNEIFVDNMRLDKLSLDLINRQQAEIERYERENNEKFDKWKLLDERTKERYAELYEEAKVVVRAEAVNEFADRLKSLGRFTSSDRYYIDKIKKEMVGDTE